MSYRKIRIQRWTLVDCLDAFQCTLFHFLFCTHFCKILYENIFTVSWLIVLFIDTLKSENFVDLTIWKVERPTASHDKLCVTLPASININYRLCLKFTIMFELLDIHIIIEIIHESHDVLWVYHSRAPGFTSGFWWNPCCSSF